MKGRTVAHRAIAIGSRVERWSSSFRFFSSRLAIAWAVRVIVGARARSRAVAEIERLGGGVAYDYQVNEFDIDQIIQKSRVPRWLLDLLGRDTLSNVVSVSFNVLQNFGGTGPPIYTRVGDANLDVLRPLTSLRRFDLSTPTDHRRRSRALRGLRRLRHLYLYNTKVTDAGLKQLEDLPDLAELNLMFTGVTDEGVAALRRRSCRG